MEFVITNNKSHWVREHLNKNNLTINIIKAIKRLFKIEK